MVEKDRVAGDRLLVIGQESDLGSRLGAWGALPGIRVNGARTLEKRRGSRANMMGDEFVGSGVFCQP